MLDLQVIAPMLKVRNSAARAAVIAAVVMDHRVLLIHDGDSARCREEFDAAVELAKHKFGDHIKRIHRSYADTRIIFERGGEVLFASMRTLDRIRGYNFDMVLEASA